MEYLLLIAFISFIGCIAYIIFQSHKYTSTRHKKAS